MSLSPSEATHNCSFLFIPTVSRGLCSSVSPSTASSLLHPVPCHAQASPVLKETSLPRVHSPSRVGETWILLCSPSQSTPSSFISCLLLGPLQFGFGNATNFLFSTTLRVYNVCTLQVWRGMQGSVEIRGASALAFQAVSLIVHSVCQTSCLISFWAFSCLYFSSYHRCIWHYMGSPVPIITAWNLQSPGAVPPCSFSLVAFPAALAASCCHVESLPNVH